MATDASISNTNELNISLLRELQGSELSKTNALKKLKNMLYRRNKELSTLMLHINKYSLPELEKMINQSFAMIKAATKLSDAMQKIDNTDPSLPVFERLIEKLINEYNVIRSKIMQTVKNKNKLNKNIVDIVSQIKDWKNPGPQKTTNKTPAIKNAQTKVPTIKTIKLDSASGDLIKKTGLKMLPPEALKVLQESKSVSTSSNKQGFTTSYNRAGVIVVNNTGSPGLNGVNSNRVMNQISNQNKESGKFWNKFEEKIDVHFDDLKKLLKETAAKNSAGGKSLLGGAADWLFDMLQSKLKNSKALKMFSKSFYKEAYADLKAAARGVLSGMTKKAGSVAGIGEEQIGKIKAFKSFISKQLESLKSVVKTQWNNAAHLVDSGMNSIVDVFSKSGKYVGNSILGFGEAVGGKLQAVTSTITKWSAETISGLERFGANIGESFSGIAGSLGKGISTITNLASKGVNAVKMAAGSIGEDLSSAFKAAGGISDGAFDAIKGIGGRGLSFLGGVGKFIPFAGDAISGYEAYKDSGSVGKGIFAGAGSAVGRIGGGVVGGLAGPVGAIAGEVGGGYTGSKAGENAYDYLFGGKAAKPSQTTNPNPVINAAPATPAVGATALPDMGGSFKTAEDYEKAGYPVPSRLRRRVGPQSNNDNGLLNLSAYKESADSLNPQASAMLSNNSDKAVLVKLNDETIGNLAMVLYALFKGRKPSGGGGFIQASYSEGGDNGVSGGTGFGAGGIGGGSNNSALGGSFGLNGNGSGANRNNGTGGNLGGNGGTAGGKRIGGAQSDSGNDAQEQAKLRDDKSLTEYAQAQASLHGEDSKSDLMKGMQSKLDGINGKLGGDPKASGKSPGKGNLAQNQQEAYNAARELGYDDKTAKAIVANASGEGLATPGALNKDYHADGSFAHMARGIVQWDPERSEAIKKQFGKYPNEMSVGDQIKAQDWEIKHNPRYAATKRALASGDPDQIQKALVHNYEGSANKDADTVKRTGIRQGLEKRDFSGEYDKSKQTATAAPEDNKIGAAMAGTAPRADSPLAATAKQADAALSPSGPAQHVKEAQGSANTRTLPIQDKLKQQLEYAGDKTGLQAEIFSGGQPAAGSGGKHTGSTRHDNGGAADLKLYETGADGKRRMLDMRNPQDAEKMKAFVFHSMEAGATGVGAAVDYMGPGGIHIGGGNTNDPTPGGKPLAWGAGGRAGAEDQFLKEAFKQGVDAQKSGSGQKAFAEWQAKKAEEAKAAIAKNEPVKPSNITAIDPQSKQASIFAPGNTPSGLKPGMGLGAMAKTMQEGQSGGATIADPDKAARDKQDQADAEAFHAKVVADAQAKANPTYSPGADSAKADTEASKPKIDQAAVMKRFGIGGDGSKSEADYADETKSKGVDRTAYSDTPLNYKGQLNGVNSKSLLTDVSFKTDDARLKPNTDGPAVDPMKAARQDFSHTMVKQGMTAEESAALVAKANKDKGIDPKSSQQILGQVSAETGFNPRSEDTRWSAAQLHHLWPRKFPTIASARALAAKGGEAEANFVYGKRKDLGNTEPGDGFNFRGRGPNQLTGRAAYKRIGDAIGVDLINHPDAVNDPVVGAAVTAQFYKEKQANGADLTTAYGATKATAPAQWQSQVDSRGKAASAFAGKTNDLADQGDTIANPGQRIEDASLTKSRMGSDTVGNERVQKQTPSASTQSDSSDSGSSKNNDSKPGVGTATGGQTTTKPDPAPQKPMVSASNDANMAPMTHGSLGMVVVNSPGLV